jgi:sialate O-acetylesterase
MVLQRGSPIPIFGRARPGEKVTVTFRGASVSATAGETWKVTLPEQAAGGPFALRIQGDNLIELKDVYVGDVWLAAGQSNMALEDEWKVKPDQAAPTVRLFNGLYPQHRAWPDTRFAVWTTDGPFCPVGWYFAREIEKEEKVHVGVIYAAQGGTAVQEWLPDARENAPYRNLVEPLLPFRIKGVIWWQGENDTWGSNRTEEARKRYAERFSAVITGWRKAWGQGDFPFLYVQLQSRGKAGSFVGEPENGPGWQLIRDGQRLAQAVPRTGMVVTYDITGGELHPPAEEKQAVARRLALAAQALAYDKKVEWSGPLLKSARFDGKDVILAFDHAEGLVAKGGPLTDFQIESGGKAWGDVPAQIIGNEVVIPARGLTLPIRVRYGYRAHPLGNLRNKAGLPASPFVTEEIR